jgi:hypothetical protein
MTQTYFVSFNIGDIACTKPSAVKGIIEKIVVKEIMVAESSSINQISYIYKDNLNQLWNSDELITYTAAKLLAQNYLNARIAAL